MPIRIKRTLSTIKPVSKKSFEECNVENSKRNRLTKDMLLKSKVKNLVREIEQ